MKKKTKHFAQYFLAGMVAFFGGKAKADNSKNTTPENAQTSMTAQNTTTTNKPNFTEVKLPTQNTPTNKLITIKIDSAKALNQGRTLYHQARDLLCLNEGCHTNGYRCSALKVTISTGCNIQDFYGILQSLNLPLLYLQDDGKTVAYLGKQRDQLCERLPQMSDKEVKRISMLPQHAEKLARETYAYFYAKEALRLAKPAPEYISLKGQTVKTTNMLSGIDFSATPVFLQAATMDTLYQLGETNFANFHLFETAIRKGDYVTAFQELAVNQTNKSTHHFKNAGLARRAFRKDLLQFAYTISKKYPKLTDKAFVIVLANVVHANTAPKTYNGSINQIEKDAAFKCVLPFIMKQFYRDLSPKDLLAKQAELTKLWKETHKHLNQSQKKLQKTNTTNK